MSQSPGTGGNGCPMCGGDCEPECGRHPAGCIFGGFSFGYWMVAAGCDRDHCDQHMDGSHFGAEVCVKAAANG